MKNLFFLCCSILCVFSSCSKDDDVEPVLSLQSPARVECYVTDGVLSNGDVIAKKLEGSSAYFFSTKGHTYGVQQISDIKKGFAIDTNGNSVPKMTALSSFDFGEYLVFVIGYFKYPYYPDTEGHEVYCYKTINITEKNKDILCKIFNKDTPHKSYENWVYEDNYEAQLKSLNKK